MALPSGLPQVSDLGRDVDSILATIATMGFKYQTKSITAPNNTPSTALAGMTFNNLTVGKTYLVFGCIRSNRSAGADLQVDYSGGVTGQVVEFEESTTAFGSDDFTQYFIRIVTPNTTSFGFLNVTGGPATILLNSFATLVELPDNFVATTDWT